jgi:hypothetical protein
MRFHERQRHSQEYIARNGQLEISQTTQSGIHNQEWRVRDYAFYIARNKEIEISYRHSQKYIIRNRRWAMGNFTRCSWYLVYVERIISNSPFLIMYSWLCRVRNLNFLIPGYVFLTMSFEKSPIAHSCLCISGYVTHEISNIVFLAMCMASIYYDAIHYSGTT